MALKALLCILVLLATLAALNPLEFGDEDSILQLGSVSRSPLAGPDSTMLKAGCTANMCYSVAGGLSKSLDIRGSCNDL
eukprot:720444-Amphidinium_carterae.1